MLKRLSPTAARARDPYREVIAILLVGALAGVAGAGVGSTMLANPVLLDTAVAFLLAAGMLLGVLVAQISRAKPPTVVEPAPELGLAEPVESSASPDLWTAEEGRNPHSVTGDIRARIEHWFGRLGTLGKIGVGTVAVGVFAIGQVLTQTFLIIAVTPRQAGIAAAACLVAAGLAATAAHYLASVDVEVLPEAPGLCRGARVMAWILVLAAGSMGLEWARQHALLEVLHYAILIVNAAVCYTLFMAVRPTAEPLTIFPTDLGPLSMLGSRNNILGSVLDSGERQLGIDLRSTWALTVVRRGLEPLAISLFLLGWLSTSLTVVGVQELGLVERLGVPVAGDPLAPGLHAHWPWPVDRVFRIPVRRVEAINIGHEGEETEGPENVLWAVAHAANEYTLVLGNGRDLVTIDAALQYRIVDARAWRYHCQNPGDALHALAYRAVMRNTVNRTLADVLSENIAALADTMSAMVQQGADSMGLGIKVVGFTFGGMHPPVDVAASYEAVISAEIRKVTAVVNAQVFRNETLPNAQSTVLVGENTARAEAAQTLAVAAGKAWSFRTLESQYRGDPGLSVFRRRLETLELGLAGHPFAVVDARFLRDGGEIWVNP
jgi:regulator of protease activity HflC (stomatin/prohibitin superfamily)